MSRDRTVGDTFYILFTTRAFATGIPTTLAGTPVVSAYEDDSIAQITAGITLGVDHDSVSGLNLLTIVATGGNGFEAGKDYNLVVTTGTVSSVSVVGEVVGQFSLGLSAAFKRLGAPAGASISADNAAIKVDTAATLLDTGTDGVVVAAASKTGYSLSTAGILAIWNQLTSALTTASTIGKLIVDNLNAAISSRASQTSVDAIPTTAMRGTDSAATSAKQDTMETTLNAIPTTAMRGTDSAATSTKQDTMETTLNAIPTTAMRGTDGVDTATMRGTDGANTVTPPSVSDILTTQMTESYAANGVAPTLAEGMFAIHQMMFEQAIAGTAWTIKKLDGSTTAFVVTLNDGTTPTGVSRP